MTILIYRKEEETSTLYHVDSTKESRKICIIFFLCARDWSRCRRYMIA
jgi:hypothetical protein